MLGKLLLVWFGPGDAQQAIKQFGPLAQILRRSAMHHRAMVKHHGAVADGQNGLRMLLNDDGRQALVACDAGNGTKQLLHDDGSEPVRRAAAAWG